MDRNDHERLSYKSAGVDIEAGNALVEKIKLIAARTRRPGVLTGLGGFASLFELPLERYRKPVLVASTDGVGTKLKLALDLKRYDTVGIDLVAMCANDIVVQGAEPLFFLDYYATGKLQVEAAARVIQGIGQGCEQAGAALVGGETAEMPGLYQAGDYDLAGFCVGIVEKDQIIDGSKVQPGDKLIGLASSGPHSNGYSLIRKIIEMGSVHLDQPLGGKPLSQWLLEPTRIYVRTLLQLMQSIAVHALAHITGGGITENLPRVLPAGVTALIDLKAWQRPPIFAWLQEQGKLDDSEMLRTFNCGVGMILCVAEKDQAKSIEQLNALGETAFPIGRLVQAQGPARVEYK